MFSSPAGNAVLVVDFHFDDEGNKCDSLLALYAPDCKQLKWKKTINHTGWSADSFVMGLQCYWSTDAKLLMVTTLHDNNLRLMFLDTDNGKTCAEVPAPFNWILQHGVILCPKSDKKDVMRLFELKKRTAAAFDPGYSEGSQFQKVNPEKLTEEIRKRNPKLAEEMEHNPQEEKRKQPSPLKSVED